MTDQLSGRALDEAAAIAMGWSVVAKIYGGDGSLRHSQWRDADGQSRVSCGEFSTDHARIPEMTAWLGQFGYLELTMWTGAEIAWHARLFNTKAHRLDMTCEGSTLSEALARLVVAVAAAKGAK